MSKSMLLICRQSPWGGMGAREALDMALAAGAYDLPVSMLFMDDGVFQLVSGQQPALLQQKDIGANLGALELFGIEQLYVDALSLQQRGLEASQLLLGCTLVDDEQLAALPGQHDLVVTL